MFAKKKIIPLLLLVVIVLPFCINIFLTSYIQYLKNNYTERLAGKQIVTLHIAQKDIVWEAQGKELLYDGKLFDVKTIQQNKDSIICSGWYDVEEENVQKKNTYITKQHTENHKHSKATYFFTYLFFEKFVETTLQKTLYEKLVYNSYSKQLINCFQTKKAPPPKILFVA
jgi:hypothetical protein